VKITRSITIPANSEYVLLGRCNNALEAEENTYLLEANENMKKVFVARCIINPTSNRIPVRVMNTRASPVRLKKGVSIGQLQSIEEVIDTKLQIDPRTAEEDVKLNRVHQNRHSPNIRTCYLDVPEDEGHQQ